MSQIEIKDATQLKLMRRAGLVVSDGLAAMCGAAAIGVTTRELDSIGREVLARNGALSSFLGYGAEYRYAHDEPGAYAAGEQYFPPELAGKQYYQPTERGLEKQIAQKLDYLHELDKQSPRKR